MNHEFKVIILYHTKVSPTPQQTQEYLSPFVIGVTPCPANDGCIINLPTSGSIFVPSDIETHEQEG